MKKWIAILVLAGITGAGFAQGRISIQLGNLSKVVNEENGVALFTPEAKIKLIVYDQEIIRVKISRDKSMSDFSYAVIKKPGGKLSKISENRKEILYSTGKISISVSKLPLRLKFMDAFGKVISQDDPSLGVSWMGNQVTNYRKLFTDERFIGLGEKTGGLNRRGSSFVNWNSDVPAYSLNQDPMYSSIPFFIGMHDKLTYGILMDNYKVVTIVDPGLKVEPGYFAYDQGVKNDYFVKYPDGTNYAGSVWPGRSHFPDFTNGKTRE